MTFRHIIYIMATALLAGVAATSCAGTDAEPQYPGGDCGDPLTLNLTLSASPLGSAVSRSGWDKEKNPEKSNEKINSWIVAIAKDGKITAVVKGLPSSPTDQASVGIELIKGEYTAIAFANMDIGKLGSLLTVGADITGWDSLSLSELAAKAGVDNLFDTPVHGNDLIPMSAIKDISVPVKDEKGLTIELTRMFCKVEFTFKNDSNDNITISKISLKPTYSGDICLFPRKEDDGSPKIPGTGTGKHEEDLTHPLAPGGVTTRDDRPHFYIKETLAGSHPTGRFHIGISLTRGDSSEEEATYALAADALKWISRNDYVLFPIVITDYVP